MPSRIKILITGVLAHSGFRRYFFNTSWLFAEQLLRMVAGLLVGIWVARYLGPEQFGVFNYAIAFTAIFGSIAKLGLDAIVVRGLVDTPDLRDMLLGTAFWLKLMGAFLALAFVALAVQFASQDIHVKLYIFIIAGGVIFQSFEVVDFYFQSLVLSKFVSICKIAQLVLSSLVKIYLILVGAELVWFVLVTLFDQMMLAISLHIAYRHQRLGSFYKKFDLAIAKQLLRDSWPLILGGLVVMIYMRIDQIMINGMLGAAEVGKYSAAVRLSEIWYVIPSIIMNSIFPSIINAKKVGSTHYYARLQRLYTILVWMAIAIALPMTFLSDRLIIMLYGEAYREAGQVLMVNIWAGIFVFLGMASGSWLASENLQQIAFYRTFGGALINILLNLVLIPVYGLVGAAVATVISYMFAGFLFDLFHEKTKSTFFMKVAAFSMKGISLNSALK
ncbi:MAG: flippase [Gallionella sp.]|nr:flippase [Gallionella sp.]MDD4947125.1 flippase [Gallionella sp.]MDD5611467.1 flippase [Gallionella sp.]